MPEQIRAAVVWIALAPVVLVGALGTGLHGLLGCEHGPPGCCRSEFCKQTRGAERETGAACHDCAFCQRRAAASEEIEGKPVPALASVDRSACCDRCAVCDLLLLYSSASPAADAALSIELCTGEASISFQNAVVSAATRLALSRGPPIA